MSWVTEPILSPEAEVARSAYLSDLYRRQSVPCNCAICSRGDDAWCCRLCHELSAEAGGFELEGVTDDDRG